MSNVIGKAFENDEDKWIDRYKEVIATLESMSSIGINMNTNVLNEMNDEQKDVHLDTLALKIIKHEWEQDAQ